MKWKQIDAQPRTDVLIFDTGDEVTTGLKTFATQEKLADASFKAIGAFSAAKFQWFNPETKAYQTSMTANPCTCPSCRRAI